MLLGNFSDGDIVSFTSVTALGSDNVTQIPKGFLAVATGANIIDEPVVNNFLLKFTNDCDIYPVLNVNDTAGWFVFVSDGKHGVCFASFLRVLVL